MRWSSVLMAVMFLVLGAVSLAKCHDGGPSVPDGGAIAPQDSVGEQSGAAAARTGSSAQFERSEVREDSAVTTAGAEAAEPDAASPPNRTQTGRLIQVAQPLAGVRVFRTDPRTGVTHEMTTANDGRFELPLVGRIEFESDRIPRGWDLQSLAPQRESELDLGDLEVPIGVAAWGRVLTPDGVPAQDATVFYEIGRSSRSETWSGSTAVDALTGAFVIENIAPGCELKLEAESPRFAMCEAQRKITKALQLDDLVLRVGRTIRGVVLCDDEPIVGAAVTPEGEWRKRVETDAGGAFTLSAVRTDTLDVGAEGYFSAEFDVASDQNDLVCRLRPAGSLRIHVLNHQGEELELEAEWPEKPTPDAEYSLQTGDTEFTIAKTPKGTCRLRAYSHLYGMSELVSISLDEGERREVTLEIRPFEMDAIEVTTATGVPVASAKVAFKHWRFHSAVECMPSVPGVELETDATGTIRFPAPEGVGGSIEVNAPGHPPFTTHVRGEDREAGVPIRVALPALGELVFRLEEGDPKFVVVHSEHESSWANPVAEFDPATRLARVQVRTGEHVVEPRLRGLANNDAFEPQPIRAVVHAGSVTEVVISVPPVTIVRGQVRRAGRAVAGATVEFRSPGVLRSISFSTLLSGYAFTRADGTFECVLAGDGDWVIQARETDGSGLPTALHRIQTGPPFEPVEVRLEFGTGRLVGRFDVGSLTERERKLAALRRDSFLSVYLFDPLDAGADAMSSPSPDAVPPIYSMHSVTPDADGDFEFVDVPAGAWLLRVVTSGSRLVAQTFVEAVAGRTVELQTLTRDIGIDVRLPCRTGPVAEPDTFHTVLVRRVDPRVPGGYFVTSTPVNNGTVTFEDAMPGDYLLEPVRITRRETELLGLDDWDEVPLAVIALRVNSDGTWTPSELIF